MAPEEITTPPEAENQSGPTIDAPETLEDTVSNPESGPESEKAPEPDIYAPDDKPGSEAPGASEDAPAEPSPVAVRQATRDALREQPQVKIMIPSTEQDKDPVPIGLNGYVYLIKRDEIVPVPMDVAQVLHDAKYDLYTQRKRTDGEEGYELVKTSAQAIPFQRY